MKIKLINIISKNNTNKLFKIILKKVMLCKIVGNLEIKILISHNF